MYLVIHIEISTIKTHNTCLYGSNSTVLTNKQTTLILSNTTQVYLKSSCAFACTQWRTEGGLGCSTLPEIPKF
jgi:hypothetical protein